MAEKARPIIDRAAWRRARRAAGYSQAALADKLDVARDTIGKIERGTLQCSADLVTRAAALLGVEPSRLYTLEGWREGLTPKEIALIRAFRRLPESLSDFVVCYATARAEGGTHEAAVLAARAYVSVLGAASESPPETPEVPGPKVDR